MATKPHGWRKRSEGRILTGRHLQAAREELFAANPYCLHCKQRGVLRLAQERDHIIPLCDGGDDEASNTQGLCCECHKIKTQAESDKARGVQSTPKAGSNRQGEPLDVAHHWNRGG